MNFDAAYIDQIVQNVMREMKSRVTVPAAVSAPNAGCGRSPDRATLTDRRSPDVMSRAGGETFGQSPVRGQETRAQHQTTEAPTSLTIAAKVVSEDILIAAQAAGRTIVVQAGAIITPSGKDYIRKNGVTVAGSALNKPVTVSTGTFIVIGSNATFQSAASATGWKTSAVSNEHDAAMVAVQSLKNGITVTCGGEPSVVACLLNRNPDVRAAVITKATNLLTLTTVMSPQVVCLDSSGWSFGDILKLLRSLSAANRPQGWKEI
jgi:hypothetical protein